MQQNRNGEDVTREPATRRPAGRWRQRCLGTAVSLGLIVALAGPAAAQLVISGAGVSGRSVLPSLTVAPGPGPLVISGVGVAGGGFGPACRCAPPSVRVNIPYPPLPRPPHVERSGAEREQAEQERAEQATAPTTTPPDLPEQTTEAASLPAETAPSIDESPDSTQEAAAPVEAMPETTADGPEREEAASLPAETAPSIDESPDSTQEAVAPVEAMPETTADGPKSEEEASLPAETAPSTDESPDPTQEAVAPVEAMPEPTAVDPESEEASEDGAGTIVPLPPLPSELEADGDDSSRLELPAETAPPADGAEETIVTEVAPTPEPDISETGETAEAEVQVAEASGFLLQIDPAQRQPFLPFPIDEIAFADRNGVRPAEPQAAEPDASGPETRDRQEAQVAAAGPRIPAPPIKPDFSQALVTAAGQVPEEIAIAPPEIRPRGDVGQALVTTADGTPTELEIIALDPLGREPEFDQATLLGDIGAEGSSLTVAAERNPVITPRSLITEPDFETEPLTASEAPVEPPAFETAAIAPAILDPPPQAPGPDFRLLFELGAEDLGNEAKEILRGIAGRIVDDGSLRLQVRSYAQSEAGIASRARRHSLNRALNIRTFLIEHGVPGVRIDIRALGDRAEEGPPDRVDLVLRD